MRREIFSKSEYEGLEALLAKLSGEVERDLASLLKREAEEWESFITPLLEKEREVWEKVLDTSEVQAEGKETEARAREIVAIRISQINRRLSQGSKDPEANP
jgi:hypothetical protein